MFNFDNHEIHEFKHCKNRCIDEKEDWLRHDKMKIGNAKMKNGEASVSIA